MYNPPAMFPIPIKDPIRCTVWLGASFEFPISETTYDVIVDHANCLHEPVTNCCPNELEPSFLQIFAHGFRLRSAGRNIRHLLPRVLNRPSLNELPDVMVKASKLFLYPQEGSSVSDGRVDFQLVSYDLRINEQSGNVILGVSGDLLDVKIVKRFSITFSLSKNGGPAQACLCSFQNKKFEQTSVVVNCYAPFIIVIGLLQLASIGPFTTFHG